jgi:hypothetical protein
MLFLPYLHPFQAYISLKLHLLILGLPNKSLKLHKVGLLWQNYYLLLGVFPQNDFYGQVVFKGYIIKKFRNFLTLALLQLNL